MKIIVKKENHYEVTVSEGTRAIVFLFKDGKMTGTKSTLPYLKTRKDWIFYSKAINRMLKDTGSFYPEQEELNLENDVPF